MSKFPAVKEHLPEKLSSETIELIMHSNESGKQFVEDGIEKNSKQAFESDLEYFWSWVSVFFYKDKRAEDDKRPSPNYFPLVQPFYPIPLDLVHHFVIHHLVEMPQRIDEQLCARGKIKINGKEINEPWKSVIKKKKGLLKYSTIKRRLSSLSKAHTKHLGTEYNSYIFSHPDTSEKLKIAAKKYHRQPSDALTIGEIKLMMWVCSNTEQGIMHKALISYMFSSGGRRASEVSSLEFQQVIKKSHKFEPGYFYEFHIRTKTKKNEDEIFAIFGKNAERFHQWCEYLGNPMEGPVFRRFTKKYELTTQALTAKMVDYIVRDLAESIGIPKEKKISAHSVRSGFVTEAAKKGIGLADIKACTGHKDNTTVWNYMRPAKLDKNQAMHLLDE